ncbi:ABC-type antimicrobial peptide transport system permease subunit [Mucilaginibacter gracilis]|uniref:ABC-type antimicrobial peptide transport system permease subunit n=1 Tax=Mucilaginibacter gracilis TaxID=423350 RepID=A0A495J9M5_9SPHI|nr:ABC transporter permease [Mucilaginibacter gracilis]RKR85726.1 ABC-type antimicrobial peptide transport system permease subunit [Mucilaginibacter gracilis]
MLKNYIKIAWRNLSKNKVISIINILGLAVGIAFTLLIGAYVWGELRVNHELKNTNNQYIILSIWKDANMGGEITGIAELPKALADNYPNLVRNYYHSDLTTTIVNKGEKHYRESIQIGDSTLLNMYGFTLLYGDNQTALRDPFSVVITQKMALKYFGKDDVTGQTLSFESTHGDKHEFIISGVLAKVPKNSVTNLNANNNSNFFFSAEAAKYFKRQLSGWANTGTVNYVELQKDADPKMVDKAMLDLIKKLEPDDVIRSGLTPYLVSLKTYNLVAEGGLIKKMTWALSCIALFILLMAIVNFVNICIGRSAGRMREIGIRKLLGGLRKQLIWQFLIESVLTVMLATLLALLIYITGRQYFSDVLGADILSIFNFPVSIILILLVFVLVIGVIAGIYPALVLSSLRSVDSLKGKLTSVKESVLLRKTLVVFQFTTAAVVFIGAIIISQQISLFFNGNLGYDKDYIVYAQLPRDWTTKGVQNMLYIRNQLAQMPQVQTVSLSFEIPDGHNGGNYLSYKQGADPKQAISSEGMVADNQFAAAYHIPLKAGTFFKPIYHTADSSQIVINETQAKALGWNNAEQAIGQYIFIPAYNDKVPFTVCGVTADFHFGSMHQKIMPEIFMNVNYAPVYRYFNIRLKPGNIQSSILALQTKWTSLLPGTPFEYHFMDDALTRLYASELQLKKAVGIATFLAVVIVLLGVLGLVSLSVQKRTKEIGIRKVLGSSVAGIITLFLKDFSNVVIVSFFIACPIAYYTMQTWLNDYAYKISISIYPFLFSITLLTSVTVLLIVVQTIRAAIANPVNSLRSE